MSKIYNASELASVTEDPEKINAKLKDIASRAYERALQGHRSMNYIISETDPSYKPVTQRLGELGFELTYYPSEPIMGHGFLTIEW